MQCFRCRAENAEGSRFCGHCGAQMDAPMRLTDPSTRDMPAGAGTVGDGLPPLGRDGKPEVVDDSLGASMRAAIGGGRGRGALIAIVVVVDLVMAGAGVMLMTRTRTTTGTGTGTATTSASASASEVASASASPPPIGIGNGDGDGSDVSSSSGSSRGSGKSSGKSGGSGGVVVGKDAAVAMAVDAGVVAPPVDAARPLDAGVAVPVDAAKVAIDADQTPDTNNAAALREQVDNKLQESNNHLSRCYSEATKALPPDQALSGEVDISFEVMPTGGVGNAAVVRNTTGSDQLSGCLAAVVGGWSFTAFSGESVTFVRTFRFAPSGPS